MEKSKDNKEIAASIIEQKKHEMKDWKARLLEAEDEYSEWREQEIRLNPNGPMAIAIKTKATMRPQPFSYRDFQNIKFHDARGMLTGKPA